MQKQKRKYSRLSSLLWAAKYQWKLNRLFIFWVLAQAPIQVVRPLVNSLFSKELIDRIGGGSSFGEIALVILGFSALILLLTLAYRYFNHRAEGGIYYTTTVLQCEMGAFQSREMDFEDTEKNSFDKVSGYAYRDAGQGNCALDFWWWDLKDFLIHVLGIFTYAALLGSLHPLLLLVVAAVSVGSWYSSRWQPNYYEKQKGNWEKEARKKDYIQNISMDFTLAKDVKLYGLEPWLNGMLRDYNAYLLMWNKRCSLRGLWAALFAGVMTLVQNGAAYLFLIGMLLGGKLTVGEFVFYFGIVGSIAGFFQGVITDVSKLATRADKIGYYRDFFDYPRRRNHGKGAPLPVAPLEIELKNVSYRYEGAEEDTLKNINLKLHPGESIALVGINGAGKSTLVKLLCGLYTPTEGEILVGGRPIDDYNIFDYYSMISAVFQEVTPIAFTIRDFVTSADPDRPTEKEDLEKALQKADIWDKISSLPNGTETHLMKGVYDDGVDLSGGEMQKLMLARAIYKNGSILILDEPTAALDPIAENKLYLEYRALTKGKTSVYISHRFASTRFCDRILLLSGGKITEEGTHQELMDLGGEYAHMFGVQSKYYKEGEIHV